MPTFPIPAAIPELIPISQQEVRAHLNCHFLAKGFLSLEEMWKGFVAAQGEDKKQLTPESKKALAELRKNIAEAFMNFHSDKLNEFLLSDSSIPLDGS